MLIAQCINGYRSEFCTSDADLPQPSVKQSIIWVLDTVVQMYIVPLQSSTPLFLINLLIL